MRIAILNADTDVSEFALRNSNDGERFVGYVLSARPGWEVEAFQAKDGELPADGAAFDGIVITGSPSSVNDDERWIDALKAFARGCIARRTPLFGACFGHQLIASALGGTVGPSPSGWRLGVAETEFAVRKPWMEPPQSLVRLFCCNREQVLTPPAEAEVLGGDPLCRVGAFAIGGHVFTTQYHPEMPRHYITALAEEMAATIGPEKLAEARDQVTGPVDGDLYGEWLARFFESAAADAMLA